MKGEHLNEPTNAYLIKEVEKLRLRFPVAEISRATGYTKGNISNYLSGTRIASGNFIAAFNKAYDLDAESMAVVSEMRDIRNKLELTQEELGRELGVTAKTIQAYEAGTQPIPESKMKLLHLYYADRTKTEKTIEDMIVERVIDSIEPMLKKMIEDTVKSNSQLELNELHDKMSTFMVEVDKKFNLVNENILSLLRLNMDRDRMEDKNNGFKQSS